MKQSQLFTKITKDTPKDEKSINSQLLIKAGFIDKLMAGGYSYLPLGFKVLKKIENIIREEMNKILGQEVLLPALHPKKNWEITNRWKYKEMFKLKSRGGKDYSLGWTHEEIITPLVKKFVKSYKDLPVFVFQIQDKFRDELRVKSGLLRAVEFIMKDLYSFHRDGKDLDEYYEKVKKAYFQIFKRCGLEKYTFLTLASGSAFSKYSHEFQTVTPFGEDEIYFCQKCKIAVNSEIIKKEKYQCPNCKSKKLEIEKAIEVGNIFKLKDKFSRAFNFNFRDENGKEKPVLMGCYGIGLGRLMGAIVEIYHDEKGIIWPSQIAPFNCHLLVLGSSKKKFERQIEKVSEKLYQDLQKAGPEVLYDDRKDKSAGEKFAEADLIGIPIRIVVSERTLEKDCVELKRRKEEKTKLIKLNQIINYVK
ncbi:MAG: aminoacyl--tRNA ligase-related protein [bacterium]|nr:aminoacyl--tRNA ligase-related protein [bacterium]